MSVDYEELKSLVKEAMFTGGGINEPSAPEGVPHRMPAADPSKTQGDPKANKLYDIALVAREATEELIVALDEPIYDDAYEHAFKATSALRQVLNSLIGSGAHPTAQQQVVAPPGNQQRFGNYVPYQGALEYGANSVAAGMMEEADEDPLHGLGISRKTQSKQAAGLRTQAKDVASGDEAANLDPVERNMIDQVRDVFTTIADTEGVDLSQYKGPILVLLKSLIKKAKAIQKTQQQTRPGQEEIE